MNTNVYPVPTCQWFRNNVALPGQTGTSLAIYNFQPADAGSYTCVVSNKVGTAASQPALLELADAYQGFVSSYGLNLVTTGAPGADYDRDGVSNLLEFVLGGNPTVAGTTILPTLTTTPITGGRNLVFHYHRRLAAAGITQGVEYATSLAATWTPAVHGQNGVTIVTSPVDAATEQVIVTIPVSGGRAFARLKAVR